MNNNEQPVAPTQSDQSAEDLAVFYDRVDELFAAHRERVNTMFRDMAARWGIDWSPDIDLGDLRERPVRSPQEFADYFRKKWGLK